MTEVDREPRFLDEIEMGLGAWQWGDRVMWGYGRDYREQDVRGAFATSLVQGIRLIDTAEIYGSGHSERLLGKFMRETNSTAVIATKFFPWPWRLTQSALQRALRGSLERMGLDKVDLYQVHWPSPLLRPEMLMEAMVECVRQGLTRAVGLSNFGWKGMLRAYSALAQHGIPLASNQVHFSLLNRRVERSGMLARCQELGVRLIAYSPLEKGILTGKYSALHPPPGLRLGQYAALLPRIPSLLRRMGEIGGDHGGKTPGQVALNWVICKGALPIPGAKTASQALENAGALGWRLSAQAVAELEEMSEQVLS